MNNKIRQNKGWANLRPAQKGEVRNPKGRPVKDCSLVSLLKEEINKIPPGEKLGRTWRQVLVLAWLTGATKNPILFKELLDRLEGKVTQPIGGEGGKLAEIKTIIIVKTDDDSPKAQTS